MSFRRVSRSPVPCASPSRARSRPRLSAPASSSGSSPFYRPVPRIACVASPAGWSRRSPRSFLFLSFVARFGRHGVSRFLSREGFTVGARSCGDRNGELPRSSEADFTVLFDPSLFSPRHVLDDTSPRGEALFFSPRRAFPSFFRDEVREALEREVLAPAEVLRDFPEKAARDLPIP